MAAPHGLVGNTHGFRRYPPSRSHPPGHRRMRVSHIEDRLDLAAAERRGVELIRLGCFPQHLAARFAAREFRCPKFRPANGRRPSEWDITLHAVQENAGPRQIAAWYRASPTNVEAVLRSVLTAYVEVEARAAETEAIADKAANHTVARPAVAEAAE